MVLESDRGRFAQARVDDEGGAERSLAQLGRIGSVYSSRMFLVWWMRFHPPCLQNARDAGAVYALVSLTALSFPSTSVSLIFLPFFPIPIGLATSALVAVDVIGLVRGWRMFDHAAHLAGAAMGAGWYFAGHAVFEQVRKWMWDGQKQRIEEERGRRRDRGVGGWVSI